MARRLSLSGGIAAAYLSHMVIRREHTAHGLVPRVPHAAERTLDARRRPAMERLRPLGHSVRGVASWIAIGLLGGGWE